MKNQYSNILYTLIEKNERNFITISVSKGNKKINNFHWYKREKSFQKKENFQQREHQKRINQDFRLKAEQTNP